MSDLDPRYLTDEYVNQNPSWDMEDSPWKAALVTQVLRDHALSPASICEVGCGAGLVLAELRKQYPGAGLFGSISRPRPPASGASTIPLISSSS